LLGGTWLFLTLWPRKTSSRSATMGESALTGCGFGESPCWALPPCWWCSCVSLSTCVSGQGLLVATWASPTRWRLALETRGRLVAKHWAHRPLQGALTGRFPVRRTHGAPMARQYSLEASSFLTDVLYWPPLQTTLPVKLVLRGIRGISLFLGVLAKLPGSPGQVALQSPSRCPCKNFKGWPPREAPSEVVQLWYKSFRFDRYWYKSFRFDRSGEIEMK